MHLFGDQLNHIKHRLRHSLFPNARSTTTIIRHVGLVTADFHSSTEIRPFPAPAPASPFFSGAYGGRDDDADPTPPPPPGTNFLAKRHPSPRAADATLPHSAGPNDVGFFAPDPQSQ